MNFSSLYKAILIGEVAARLSQARQEQLLSSHRYVEGVFQVIDTRLNVAAHFCASAIG